MDVKNFLHFLVEQITFINCLIMFVAGVAIYCVKKKPEHKFAEIMMTTTIIGLMFLIIALLAGFNPHKVINSFPASTKFIKEAFFSEEKYETPDMDWLDEFLRN